MTTSFLMTIATIGRYFPRLISIAESLPIMCCAPKIRRLLISIRCNIAIVSLVASIALVVFPDYAAGGIINHFDEQPERRHSALAGKSGRKDTGIRDDAFASLMKEILISNDQSNVLDAKFLFQTCYGGGMLDNLNMELGKSVKWVGGSASKHNEYALGQRTQRESDNSRPDTRSDLIITDRPHGFWTEAIVGELGNTKQPLLDGVNKARDKDKAGINAKKELMEFAKKTIGQSNESGQSISANGGEMITLGDPTAKSHHAILWAGGALHRTRNTNDITDVREKLVKAWGDPKTNSNVTITVFFGSGRKGDGRRLPKDWDVRQATKEELSNYLRNELKVKLNSNEQFFFYATGHGSNRVELQKNPKTVPSDITDAEPLVLESLILDAMSADDENIPTLSVSYTDLTASIPVYFNDSFLGELRDNPVTIAGSLSSNVVTQIFNLPESLVGTTNVVRIENTSGSDFTLIRKEFSTGDIGEIGHMVPEPSGIAIFGTGVVLALVICFANRRQSRDHSTKRANN